MYPGLDASIVAKAAWDIVDFLVVWTSLEVSIKFWLRSRSVYMDKSLSVHELVLVDILHVEMENVQVEAFDTFFSSFDIYSLCFLN